jgi:hypothetical protein
VIPLLEVLGKAARAAPEQMAATGVNVGVMIGSMVTEVVTVIPGQPATPATA